MIIKYRKIHLHFWMTVCAIPCLAILLGLGTWQLERLKWKNNIVAERTERLSFPPIYISDVEKDKWASLEFRRIIVRGYYMHKGEMLIVNKVRKGQAGFHLITPFKAETGPILFVNRGWVPNGWREGVVNQARETEPIELIGTLRIGGRQNRWLPQNEPAKDIWFFVDVEQMAARTGSTNHYPYLIELTTTQGGASYPKAKQAMINIRNKHLEYALTWYGLALTLVVIYAAYHIRQRDGQN